MNFVLWYERKMNGADRIVETGKFLYVYVFHVKRTDFDMMHFTLTQTYSLTTTSAYID